MDHIVQGDRKEAPTAKDDRARVWAALQQRFPDSREEIERTRPAHRA